MIVRNPSKLIYSHQHPVCSQRNMKNESPKKKYEHSDSSCDYNLEQNNRHAKEVGSSKRIIPSIEFDIVNSDKETDSAKERKTPNTPSKEDNDEKPNVNKL